VLGTQVAAVARPGKELDRNIATWLRPHLHDRERVIASTLRFQEQLAARVGDAATVSDVRLSTSSSAPKLDDVVLVDWAAGEYRSARADALAALLRRSDWLVLTGGDPRLNPVALARWLQLNGATVGLDAGRIYNPSFRGAWAGVYAVNHARVDEIPTIVTVAAATRLLRSHRFVVQRPTVIAGRNEELARLAGKLPPRPDVTTLVVPPS
jgi:hypothetical protein